MNKLTAFMCDYIIKAYDNESEEITVVEEGEWESQHKHQYRDIIVEFEERFFCICETRYGSYHQGYEYEDSTVHEVWPKQVTITKWVDTKPE